MLIRAPLVTLGAVAALGTGILLTNIAQQPDAPVQPASQAAPATAAPATAAAPVARPPAFPARADYVGAIPTATGVIELDIAVDRGHAVAYACDNVGLEVWLRGPAADGAVSLTTKDGAGSLDGRLYGDAVSGQLVVGERVWEFTATRVQGADDA